MSKPKFPDKQNGTPTPAFDDDNTVAIPRPANELDGDKSALQPDRKGSRTPRGS